MSLPTIKRMEAIGIGRSAADTVLAVQRSLEAAGVQLTEGGGPRGAAGQTRRHQKVIDATDGAARASGRYFASDRLVGIMDRLLLYTTAIVGLISLAATMVVQYETQQRFQRIEAILNDIRLNIDLDRVATDAREAMAKTEQAGLPVDDGTIDALLSLQDRIAALEQSGTITSQTGAQLTGDQQAIAAGLQGPTDDCIPLGTRFMTQIGDKFPICHTPLVVDVISITADTATIHNAGTLVENGTGAFEGTPCQVTLLSADVEGFADMRVGC